MPTRVATNTKTRMTVALTASVLREYAESLREHARREIAMDEPFDLVYGEHCRTAQGKEMIGDVQSAAGELLRAQYLEEYADAIEDGDGILRLERIEKDEKTGECRFVFSYPWSLILFHYWHIVKDIPGIQKLIQKAKKDAGAILHERGWA